METAGCGFGRWLCFWRKLSLMASVCQDLGALVDKRSLMNFMTVFMVKLTNRGLVKRYENIS